LSRRGLYSDSISIAGAAVSLGTRQWRFSRRMWEVYVERADAEDAGFCVGAVAFFSSAELRGEFFIFSHFSLKLSIVSGPQY
jgi:hypothetical protein